MVLLWFSPRFSDCVLGDSLWDSTGFPWFFICFLLCIELVSFILLVVVALVHLAAIHGIDVFVDVVHSIIVDRITC